MRKWAGLQATCLAFVLLPWGGALDHADAQSSGTPNATTRTARARSAIPPRNTTLRARLDALWETEPIPARAFAGLAVLDLKSGKLLYSRNGAHLFVPASNAKLFSTALALMRLGPDHRMTTEVLVEGMWAEGSGVVNGDLVLRGAGDPSLSSRRFPYSVETEDVRDYPIAAIEELADAITAKGIRRIAGDVVGDDQAYLWEPFQEGWAQDDALFDYGAPVSALSVNDNFVEILARPGAGPGAPALVELRPELPYYEIRNTVRTTARQAGRIGWDRAPGRTLLLHGSITSGAGPWRGRVAIDDPALFGAHCFRDALARRGVQVDGQATARHRFEGEVSAAAAKGATHVLARHESPPLSEVLRTVNKESMNLFAELLLREVPRARTGAGSRREGLQELRGFLAEAGISHEGVSLADASGLARLSLVSPEATARLLGFMWRSPHREVWLASLPVGGNDGTLERRFQESRHAQSIRAKTGTLRGVGALSGYVTTKDGALLAFSAYVNNHPGTSRMAREFLDRMALEIASTGVEGAR